MLKRNIYKPRYKIAFQAKSKIWIYKDSRLRHFFSIRGRKLIRRGFFKRKVLVFNNMKWTLARRKFRPYKFKRRPVFKSYKNSFYTKQQLRYFYSKGRESSFRNFFRSYLKFSASRNLSFFSSLESRLDIFFFRLRFLPTIFACQQLIYHHGILLNGKLISSSKIILIPGDQIQVPFFYWHFFYRWNWYRVFFRIFGKFRLFRRYRRILKKKFRFFKKRKFYKKKSFLFKIKKWKFFFFLVLFLSKIFLYYSQKLELKFFFFFKLLKKFSKYSFLKYLVFFKKFFKNFFFLKRSFFIHLNKKLLSKKKKPKKFIINKLLFNSVNSKLKNRNKINTTFFFNLAKLKLQLNSTINQNNILIFYLKNLLLLDGKIQLNFLFKKVLKKKKKINYNIDKFFLYQKKKQIIKNTNIFIKKNKTFSSKKKLFLLKNVSFKKKKWYKLLSLFFAKTKNLSFFWLQLRYQELQFYKFFLIFIKQEEKQKIFSKLLIQRELLLFKTYFRLKKKIFSYWIKILKRKIRRFRPKKIRKNRFHPAKKKLKARFFLNQLTYFVLIRSKKKLSKKKIIQRKSIHWYIPSYIYLDFVTLRATLLRFPQSTEIFYSFKCSLSKIYSFYKSLGV